MLLISSELDELPAVADRIVVLQRSQIKGSCPAAADGAWGSPWAIDKSVNNTMIFALVGTGFVLAA